MKNSSLRKGVIEFKQNKFEPDFLRRVTLLCLTPGIALLTQELPLNQISSNPNISRLVVNKIPIALMFLGVFLIALLRSRQLRYIPRLRWYFGIPALFIFLYFMNKSLIFFGHADKTAIYSNPAYWLWTCLLVLTVKLTVSHELIQWKRLGDYGYFLIASVICLYLASFLIVPLNHSYFANSLNYMIVLHSIVQSAFGKWVAFNQYSQYGGYGNFFKPVWLFVHPTETNISTLFAVIFLISLLCIYFITFKLIKNQFIAFISGSAAIYAQCFSVALWPYEKYFQVYPIRMIFPLLSIALFIQFGIEASKMLVLHGLIIALSIFWNLETGIVLLVALIIAIIFQHNTPVRIRATRLLVFIASFTATSIVYFIVGTAGSHSSFNWELFTRPLSAYGSGGVLIWNKAWVLVVILYALGISYGFNRAAGDVGLGFKYPQVSYVAIVGMGLLLYHIVRPNQHEATLGAVAFPIPMILGALVWQELRLYTQPTLSIRTLKRRKREEKLASSYEPRETHPKNYYYFRNPVGTLGLVFLCLMAVALVYIQHGQIVRDEPRFWELNNSASMKSLFQTSSISQGLHYVTIGEEIKGNLPPWVIRSNVARDLKVKGENSDLLILSEWDALMYLESGSRAPVSWGDWYHNFYDMENREVENAILTGKIQRVLMDQYPGVLMPPFGVHAVGQDEGLIAFIKVHMHKTASYDGGYVYTPQGKDNWSDSTLTLYATNVSP